MSEETNEVLPEGAPEASGIPAAGGKPAPKLPPSMQPTEPPAAPPDAPEAPDDTMSTGSSVLDLVVDMVSASTGATPADFQRAMGKALEYGRLDLLDEAFIQERFKEYAPKVLLIAKEALAIQEAEKAQQAAAEKALLKTVYDAAGGQEQWETAVKLFNQHADPAVKEVTKTLFNAGSDAATQAAIKYVLDTAQAQGVVLKPQTSFRPNADPTASGLSAAGFQTELAALAKEFGPKVGSPAYDEKYQALVTRRAAGKRAGL